MASWMGSIPNLCNNFNATLCHIRLYKPSMLLLGCEDIVYLSSPTFLLFVQWVWLAPPILGLLWERVEGVFSANWMTLLSLLAV